MTILAVALETENDLRVSCEDHSTVAEHVKEIINWVNPDDVYVTCVCVTGLNDADKAFAQMVEDALDEAYGIQPWSGE
jgi:GTP-dependent phosphoenolpyruvate carboxykinase